ncbi:MAG: helix-turn-helix domain-containing protein [Candidatus Bathyarchaeia archaeon]
MLEKEVSLLKKIGLTEYEAGAYLLLLEKGALTAKQISYGAQIPYSKVYQVIKNLEQKGWIETIKKRPSKYFPKSPKIALMMAKKALENEWLSIERTLLDELSPLYEKLQTREKYDIWILRGLSNILPKIKEMIKNAGSEMLIALPSIKEDLLIELLRALESINIKRLKIRFMVSMGMSEYVYVTLGKIGEVKLKSKMFGGGVITDSGEVMLVVGDEKGEITAIWSDHPGLAWLAKDYFNYLWKEPEY